MTAAPAIDVRGLSKAYGGRRAVDQVDLDVQLGEIVGLLGANGAGKTTIAECIQGLRRPDSGYVRVFGLDPATHGARVRRLIGSQQQASALPDRMRVGEAVALFRTPGASPGDGLLETFGLAAERKTSFAALSGGQRQRLFLILAVLNRPRLVILDELTQGLDPAARRDVWEAIRVLRESGTTVLLVTHYMDEAEALCDRVVVVRDGRMLDAGTPAELVRRHADWASIRFRRCSIDLEQLQTLPGVRSIDVDGGTVEVRGDRIMIAHVCAALVHVATSADIQVFTPDLESAMIAVLTDHGGRDTTQPVRIMNASAGGSA